MGNYCFKYGRLKERINEKDEKKSLLSLPTPRTTYCEKPIFDIDFHHNGCESSLNSCQHHMIIKFEDGSKLTQVISAINIKKYYRNFIKSNDHHFDYVTPEYISRQSIF